MARSSGVARRLGVLGLGALVVGAVLLGTGVAVSAQGTPAGQQPAPLKKGTTTTSTSTSTTTTLPGATTTTLPCGTPTTATGVNSTTHTTASMTMTPGNCIVDGTVVTLSGSGFQQSIGVFLYCNSDPGQPTVAFESKSNQTPVSCTDPLVSGGPGIVGTSVSGILPPTKYTIHEGFPGPPCGACTGISAKDSTGGSPFTDAGNYPCPPTAAQLAKGDTCGILYGNSAGDAVTVPIAFNVAVPPPAGSLTTPTAPPASATASGAATTSPAAQAGATKAGSSSLAFTGAGPGLWWLALVGMVLMVLGIFALALVDQPRRLLRLATSQTSKWRKRSPS